FDPGKVEALLPALKKLAPRNVALVMTPAEIEYGFQRRFLEMATRLDDDPFVDFAFGYFTGATGEEAQAFVRACLAAPEKGRPVVLGHLGGGNKTSLEPTTAYDFRASKAPVVNGWVKGDETDHDREFVAKFLPKLAACTAIELAGHGYPDQVVGGLDAKDVAG